MAKAKAKAKKAPKTPQTAVFVGDYKGKQTFGIWNVDADGDKTGDYPLIAFGIAKAKALLRHAEELEDYVTDQITGAADDAPAKKKKPAKASASDEDDEEDEAPVKRKAKKEEPKKKKKPKVVRRAASDSDDD